MLRRTASAAFAADMYVFPGGRVDDVDHAAELEPYCDGLDDAAASARARHRPRRPGVLGGRGPGVLRGGRRAAGPTRATAAPLVRRRGDRRAVHDGELSMEELCRRHDLVLDLSAIRYVAHWVTPVGEGPRRFDTRFFLAAAPDGPGGRPRRRRDGRQPVGAPGRRHRPRRGRRAADDAADDRQPALRRRVRRRRRRARRRRRRRARRRGSSPKLRHDRRRLVARSACPATPTTTRLEPDRSSERVEATSGDARRARASTLGRATAAEQVGGMPATRRRRGVRDRRRQPRRARRPTISANAVGGRAGRAALVERHRPTGVAAGGHGRLERHLTEQRDADLVGQRRAAAGAEQRRSARRGRT